MLVSKPPSALCALFNEHEHKNLLMLRHDMCVCTQPEICHYSINMLKWREKKELTFFGILALIFRCKKIPKYLISQRKYFQFLYISKMRKNQVTDIPYSSIHMLIFVLAWIERKWHSFDLIYFSRFNIQTIKITMTREDYANFVKGWME